jgi:hypothetical protein
MGTPHCIRCTLTTPNTTHHHAERNSVFGSIVYPTVQGREHDPHPLENKKYEGAPDLDISPATLDALPLEDKPKKGARFWERLSRIWDKRKIF